MGLLRGRYAAPPDAAAGDSGRGAAARIVRGLLRVAPADRDDAAAAAAKLEVLLFVLPLLPPGACACGGGFLSRAARRRRRVRPRPQVARPSRVPSLPRSQMWR